MGMVFLPFALLLTLGGQTQPRPVIVELFTSEGCSSCPPADEMLRRLEAQPVPAAQMIALGFHVDYWDNLGWRDRFSDAAFTARQRAYARAFHQSSVYTPEMVVDGRTGFAGSAQGAAVDAIRDAARRPSAPILLRIEEGTLKIHLPDLAALHGTVLWLVITQNSLTSDVLRGENGGRRLHHDAVARRLQKVGPAEDASVPLAIPAAWEKDQLHAVVFAQDPASLAILGAASVSLR
ncbi:MAG TPA: DUF1223 domain-containing protein [Holophagaceae bacterium]|jgi:hypothetical protein|nr:DUF1223 domain-containing protein [Holophagaceae bacterium]